MLILGAYLKEERVKRDITIETLSLNTSLAASYLKRVEDDNHQPSLKKLKIIVDGLVSMDKV